MKLDPAQVWFVFVFGDIIPVAVVEDWGAHLYQGGRLSAEHLRVQDFSLQLASDECQVSANQRPGQGHIDQ